MTLAAVQARRVGRRLRGRTRDGAAGRPGRLVRARARAIALAVLAVAVGGCIGTLPILTPSPAVESGVPDAAIQATRAQLEAALRAANFGLIDYRQTYRPPETPALAAAPRATYQIVLPADPNHGIVVVYDLRNPATAQDAARAYATFLGSGPTRVNFPPDTRFVVRQLGSTIVLFTWSRANSPDGSGGLAADAIDGVGTGYPVP